MKIFQKCSDQNKYWAELRGFNTEIAHIQTSAVNTDLSDIQNYSHGVQFVEDWTSYMWFCYMWMSQLHVILILGVILGPFFLCDISSRKDQYSVQGHYLFQQICSDNLIITIKTIHTSIYCIGDILIDSLDVYLSLPSSHLYMITLIFVFELRQFTFNSKGTEVFFKPHFLSLSLFMHKGECLFFMAVV